jgi:host factor-I protein
MARESARRSRRISTIQQPGGKAGRAPEQTFEEAKYLKRLIESGTPVRVKMEDGEEVVGVIEYYDQSFIRITREGEPNLFIFKHDIKYLSEES